MGRFWRGSYANPLQVRRDQQDHQQTGRRQDGQIPGQRSKFLAEDGSPPKDIVDDALHWTDKGYDIWGAAVEPSLQALLQEKQYTKETIMRGLLLVGVLCGAVLLTAPTSGQDKTPAKADIRGVIQKVNPVKKGGEVLASILVDNPKKDTSYDKASVTITKKTKLLRVGAADDRAPTVADLKVGARVEVIFDGPVAESYPVQGRAGVVRILVKEEK